MHSSIEIIHAMNQSRFGNLLLSLSIRFRFHPSHSKSIQIIRPKWIFCSICSWYRIYQKPSTSTSHTLTRSHSSIPKTRVLYSIRIDRHGNIGYVVLINGKKGQNELFMCSSYRDEIIKIASKAYEVDVHKHMHHCVFVCLCVCAWHGIQCEMNLRNMRNSENVYRVRCVLFANVKCWLYHA